MNVSLAAGFTAYFPQLEDLGLHHLLMIDPDHPGAIDAHIKTFLRAARRAVGIGGEVGVRITSSLEMRRLNRDFLGKDRPTDVLSFPAAQNGKMAGDIAISRDIARRSTSLASTSLIGSSSI